VTLTVSAASDLGPAFREIGSLFEEQTGIKASFNFGSTGQLAQQIEQGAPVDLFAAADVARIDSLEAKGRIIPDTRKVYAQGRITLWTRADSPLQIERVEDLLQPGVQRIAIANPDHAPYGVAARQALQSAGIWEKLQDKLVLAENAQQTLQYAQTGNVDAAIVPLSLSNQDGGRWVLIPAELHRPIVQALAVIKGTAHEREARSFADFITGPQGQEVLRRHDFSPPDAEPAQ
jgi:molybdate transport system substrate-binding protein